MTYRWLSRAAMVIVLGILLAAMVHDVRGAETGDTWVTGGAKSFHGDRSVPHNEWNVGLGLERYLSPDLRLGLAVVDNSFWKPSAQAYAMFTPYALGGWKLGVAGGFATGYGRWPEPVVLGVATRESGRFGVDVVAFPPVATFQGFAAVRLKFKWEGQ